MKKYLVVLTGIMMLLLFVPTASATYILCGGAGSGGGGGTALLPSQPVNLTCPSITVPTGEWLSSVDVEYVNDAQGPASSGVTITFTWNTTALSVITEPTQSNTEFATGTTFGSCQGSGINATCPTFFSVAEHVASLGSFGPFQVGVSAAPEGVFLSDGGDSAHLYIQYDYSSNVPEPATFGLIGGVLLGLGLFGSKKFSRR
jgi:hypothetical protein